MLKQLHIRNLVLIKNTIIPFNSGLNVISGETGSGKSAIMTALHLLMGDRADLNLLRYGCEKGSVDGAFDISSLKELKNILDHSGIQHNDDEDLILRRELHQGKSRALINHQVVQTSFLKKVSSFLLNMVGQHATHDLFSLETQREILDSYGDLNPLVKHYTLSWEEENKIKNMLQETIQEESNRLLELKKLHSILKEIEEAKLKEGEDEDLFTEYKLLSTGSERIRYSQEIVQALNSEKNAVISTLLRTRSFLQNLIQIDPSLNSLETSYQNTILELQEIFYTLQHYTSRIEFQPERMELINQRLNIIDKLKKYGSTISEILEYAKTTKEKIYVLENADETIEILKKKLTVLEQENKKLTDELSFLRKEKAKLLEIKLIEELRSLNMPKVEFVCLIKKIQNHRYGCDQIEFFLRPNIGEQLISIKECASGGELSRLMLSLQTLLAGKTNVPLLVFDEIDGNIGGETATIVGQKLKEIGKNHQVFCITHFPQVAKQGEHHLQISKIEKDGRTFTEVNILNQVSREKELSRMAGNTYQ